MSNFAFIEQEWPEVFEECSLAETYLTNDPRSACIYGRRVAEMLVQYIYEVSGLPESYVSDLAARVNDPAFKNLTGHSVTYRLNAIRKVGNTAAHGTGTVSLETATQVLRDLYTVVKWAMFNYSTNPGAVPLNSEFDPKLAAARAPLSCLLYTSDAADE